MRNMVMTPSPLKKESFATNNQSSCVSIPMVHSFDSSFSSSASNPATWDQCFTPTSQNFSLSRRQSSGSIDMEGLSSSRSSITGSVSPSEQMFLPMTIMGSMTQNMLTSMPSNDNGFLLYSTPGSKSVVDTAMANFDYQNVSMYNPLETQDFLCDMPPLSFDGSSPLPLGSSPHPHQYVDPLHTTFEPLCPSTPMHVKRSSSALGSPLDSGSGSRPNPAYIQHFMSPPNAYTSSRSSPLSSKSFSTVRRMPPSSALESSTALHLVQSTGSSRARKSGQRKPQLDFVAAGRFFCDFRGCKSKQQGFRRQEHLKRHKKTHLEQKDLICEFCARKFQQDRSDNYRSHVKLHAKRNKGARTKYFPDAEALVKIWAAERDRKAGGEKISVEESVAVHSTRRTMTLQSSPDIKDGMDF